MKQWLHRFPFMASCINTTLLVILWSTDLITEDSISLESHLAALRDRYEAYLVSTGESNLVFNCDGFNPVNQATNAGFCQNCACKVEGLFVLRAFNLFIAGGVVDEQFQQS